MKICGIICELNPAHNGHQYLVEKAKELTNADYVVAIMSGNMVQRGEPAIYNFKIRAQMALNIGFDCVFYLPSLYTLNSANEFAKYAVYTFNQLNINSLVFGCSKTKDEMDYVVNLSQNDDFNQELKNYLSQGYAYSISFAKCMKEIHNIVMDANDILAMQYIKNIYELDDKIEIKTVQRQKNLSASYLRQLILNNKTEAIKHLVNDSNFKLIQKHQPINYQKFNEFVFYNICNKSINDLINIKGIKEGIENKIFKSKSNTLNSLKEELLSKRYSDKFLKRLFCNIAFNIKKDNDLDRLPFVKVVALNKIDILKHINSNIPIITNLKNKTLLKKQSIYDFDNQIDKIYNIITNSKDNNFPYNKIIIHNIKGIL